MKLMGGRFAGWATLALLALAASGSVQAQTSVPDMEGLHYFFRTMALDHGTAEQTARARGYAFEQIRLDDAGQKAVLEAAGQYAREMDRLRVAHLEVVRSASPAPVKEAQVTGLRQQRDVAAAGIYERLRGQLGADRAERLHRYLFSRARPSPPPVVPPGR